MSTGRVFALAAIWIALAIPLAVAVGRRLARQAASYRSPRVRSAAISATPFRLPFARVSRWGERFAWGAAAAALVAVGLGPVAVARASEALPGSPMWPVKLAIEDAQLAVARDPAARLRLHVRFAARRLQEVDRLLRQEADMAPIHTVIADLGEHTRVVGDALRDGRAMAGLRSLAFGDLFALRHSSGVVHRSFAGGDCGAMTRCAAVARALQAAEAPLLAVAVPVASERSESTPTAETSVPATVAGDDPDAVSGPPPGAADSSVRDGSVSGPAGSLPAPVEAPMNATDSSATEVPAALDSPPSSSAQPTVPAQPPAPAPPADPTTPPAASPSPEPPAPPDLPGSSAPADLPALSVDTVTPPASPLPPEQASPSPAASSLTLLPETATATAP